MSDILKPDPASSMPKQGSVVEAPQGGHHRLMAWFHGLRNAARAILTGMHITLADPDVIEQEIPLSFRDAILNHLLAMQRIGGRSAAQDTSLLVQLASQLLPDLMDDPKKRCLIIDYFRRKAHMSFANTDLG